MTRRRRGYQQDIDMPLSLGFRPTTWTEPASPNLQRATWTTPNTGASRNYGSTPGYVDTVPHRWSYGEKGAIFNQLAPYLAKNKAQSMTSAGGGVPPPSGGGFTTPPSGPPATGPGVPPPPPAFPAPTGGGIPVPPPPSVRRATAQARSTGQPLSTPPLPSQGVPTPPPPTGRQVLRVPPLSVPPMGSQGSDFLTASARSASDEPFTPNVEWRDEPENPFPMGTRKEFDVRRMFDPDYLPAKERSTTPANSRTQNRKPKNT